MRKLHVTKLIGSGKDNLYVGSHSKASAKRLSFDNNPIHTVEVDLDPMDSRISTYEQFKEAQEKHLKALAEIRAFIFGDENNQPQVTYMPKIAEFDKLYREVKEWLDTAYFEDDD